MAFDIATARPAQQPKQGFDLSTAKPFQQQLDSGGLPTGPEAQVILQGLPGARAARRASLRPESISDLPLLETPEAQQRISPQETDTSIIGRLVNAFTGEGRRTVAEQQAEEIGITGPSELPLGDRLQVSGSLLFAASPEERIQAIRESVPEAKFSRDVANNVFVDFGQGNKLLNRPGFSAQDAQVLASDVIQFGLGAKGFQQLFRPQTVGSQLATGAAGGAAVSTAREAASAGLGGEFDIEQPLIEGAFGAVGEIPAAFQAGRRISQAKELGVERAAVSEVLEKVERAQEVAERTGIRLFPAQKTLDPFALEEQSFVASLPAASRSAAAELAGQNRDVFASVKKFINQIAPPAVLQRASRRVRTAAQRVEELAKQRRQDIAGPIYREAFADVEAVNRIDLGPVNAFIKERSKAFPQNHPVTQVLRAFSRDLKGEVIPAQPAGKVLDATGEPFIPAISSKTKPLTLEQLQGVKETIDAKLQRLEGIKPGAATNKARRALIEAETILLDQLDKASPTFKEARAAFAAASPEVNAIKEGILGEIAGVKDTRLKSISGILFDPAETDPTVLRNARDLIEEVDPDAWTGILRVEARKRMKNVSLDRERLTPDNAPAKILRALFGEGEKRDIFLDSLPTDVMRENAKFLEEALGAAALGRPGGSQTGVRAVITNKLRGFGFALRRFFKSPVDRLIETGEESAFNRSASALGAALFDPQWQPRLTDIRTDQLSIPEATAAMGQLLKDVIASERAEKKRERK